jgi:uncharacterized protein YegP (UPF0339 family)
MPEVGAPTGTLPSSYGCHLEREPADAHFRKFDAGRPAIGPAAPQPPALPETSCRFEVYRADEVKTSSTLFAGGDWRWQLSDAAGQILVEAGGYRSEDECRQAVALLQRHVPCASIPTTDGGPRLAEWRPDMDTDNESQLAHERHLATTEERMVLALEMIADQLRQISRGFLGIGDVREGQTAFATMAATEGDGGRDDDEGGHSEPQAFGVKRTLAEHFAVGGYAYTNLAHAIAQAKRDRLLGDHR